MRLNSLHLTNFRQHVDTRIDFDVGITGIIGPNGSGKSTILEAIAWALYGTPAARGTRDTIRWHRAAARAPVRVELDFELAGHRYVVTRGLNDAEVYLDGAIAAITSSSFWPVKYVLKNSSRVIPRRRRSMSPTPVMEFAIGELAPSRYSSACVSPRSTR